MKINKILQLIIMIFFIMSSISCENSGSESSYSPQENTSSKLINESGGRVELDAGTSKAVAIIPEDALSHEENISITLKKDLPQPLPQGSLKAGECIKFGPEGTVFNKNALLGIPYNDANNDNLIDSKYVDVSKIKINYYDESLGEWTILPVKSLDRTVNMAYFSSNHFSNYIVFVDEQDSIPLDNTQLNDNEYFVNDPNYYYDGNGNLVIRPEGCINRKDLPCSDYWHLSIFRHEADGIISIVDQFYTTNHLGGNHVEISEDGTSITFDAIEIFEKVKRSGDARLWDWQCEFVIEHTKLLNYIVVEDDDPDYIQTPDDQKIYAAINSSDQNKVTISWKINIKPEMKPGKTLCIRFEARYKPNGL